MDGVNNIDELLKKEFLITNGIGGYASSSLSFANTRKYHGLLIASDNPPTQRNILVHKVEERIKLGDDYLDLSTNKYGDVIHPHGYNYLKSFERLPVAKWQYSGDGWSVTKEVMMLEGSNTTIIRYHNQGDSDLDIELHPLFTYRDYHSILRENQYDFYYESLDKAIKIHPFPDSKPIFYKYSQGDFTEERSWYKSIHYDRTAYRGMDPEEDSYRIGFTTMKIKAGRTGYILFTDDEAKLNSKPATAMRQLQKEYDTKAAMSGNDDFLRDLLISGDQFVVDRASTQSKSILAGYHWFTDWGRDTMIAMRGLTISANRKKESESILKTFFEYLDRGMLPNRFPDHEGQEVEYNTIDATLWLFIVLHEYYQKFQDLKFIKKYVGRLEDVIEQHIAGTRYDIHVNDKGFIQGGVDGYQLTWMDAKVDGYVVTPRIGCPVEITALWYNALKIFDGFNLLLKQNSKIDTKRYIDLVEKNFRRSFMSDSGYLYDYIDDQGNPNADFRCNQIYAVSLPYSLLNNKEEKAIVQQVGEKLVTGYGLRSLDSDNPAFIPIYHGDQWSRDTAYHQGTVWAFVLGEYCEAYLKVHKYTKKAKREIIKLIKPLQDHFYEHNCVHGISEIFDGADPSDGRGCINQAWSVSSLIKIYIDHKLYEL